MTTAYSLVSSSLFAGTSAIHFSASLPRADFRSSPASLMTSLNAVKLSSHLRGILTLSTETEFGSISSPKPVRYAVSEDRSVTCTDGAASASTAGPPVNALTASAAAAHRTAPAHTAAIFLNSGFRNVTISMRFPPFCIARRRGRARLCGPVSISLCRGAPFYVASRRAFAV